MHEDYEALLARVPSLGPPAVSALYEALEQISERDEKRRPILQRCRQLLGSILLERQLRSRARESAASGRSNAQVAEVSDVAPAQVDDDGFVGLQRELLTGTSFFERGGGITESGTESDNQSGEDE